MARKFIQFVETFKPVEGEHWHIDGHALTARIKEEFGVIVPDVLTSFWNEIGTGYFADRELYLFGTTGGEIGTRKSTGVELKGLLEANISATI